jgi:Ca2+-transporting ATPase
MPRQNKNSGKQERETNDESFDVIDEFETDINYHSMDLGETLDHVESDASKGLSTEEAEERLEELGPNILREEGRTNPLILLLHQFFDVLIALLFIAAIVSIIFGDWIDAIVIFAIVIINAIIGFVQEYQAEKSIEELKKIVTKEVRILRDSEEHIIDAKNLTIGDIVLIEAGEKVPADMRLLTSTSLKVDESPLTGESISLSKNAKEIIDPKAVVGDRRNMLFTGTTVTYGRAKAVVVKIGMETEMGKIATLMQKQEKEQTPLQKNLDKLGKVLGITIVIICSIVFATVMIKHWIEFGNFEGWIEALETALALAVSAVPEGLPAAITLTYAIGVRMMAKKNAIVSRLPAVETLGIVDVICSDKTGTLTRNEMTVREIRTLNHHIKVTGVGYKPEGKFIEDGEEIKPEEDTDLLRILRTSQLCNNSEIHYDSETEETEIIGDPTEVALKVMARKAGLHDEKNFPREAEVFFDSQRKRMTTVNRQTEKAEHEEDLIAYTKGSPPVVLELCKFISIDGKVSPIDEGQKKEILSKNDEMAADALRVLAIAYRMVDERLIEVEQEDFISEMEKNLETDLIFLGLVGMIDPARPEVEEALKKCRTAGIEAVMVTGDQKITAEAIAKDIGLVEDDYEGTITGSELEEMSEKELKERIEDTKIFARVSPEHKHRIVSTFQEMGHTVATTGDGVNDAPAVRKAEIGVAMGIQGTDVTREAAQMVLADDNFATIVTAVERGRTIFQNMLKFIRYLIASNFDEILTVFVCVVFLGLKSPYTAIQILWINLVTDGLPAIALSVDPPLSDIMRQPPRDKNEGFMKDIYIFSMIAGILAFAASMIVFVPIAEVGEAINVGETWNSQGDIVTNFDAVLATEALNELPDWMITFAQTFTFHKEIIATTMSSEGWYAHARTLNFTMSIVFEMFNVFITRSGFERTTLKMNPFNNIWIWGSITLALGLQMIAIYVPMAPVSHGSYFEWGINNTIFDSQPMIGYAWLLIVGICIIAAALMELFKYIIGKFILKEWVGSTKKEAIVEV